MRVRQNPPPPSPSEKAALIRRAHDEAKAARAQSPHLSHAALFGEAMRRLYRAYAEGWLTEHCGATPADLAQLRAVSDGSYGYLQGKFRAAQKGRPDRLEARIDAAAGRLSADPEVQSVIRCGFPQPPVGQGRIRPAPIPVVEAPVEPVSDLEMLAREAEARGLMVLRGSLNGLPVVTLRSIQNNLNARLENPAPGIYNLAAIQTDYTNQIPRTVDLGESEVRSFIALISAPMTVQDAQRLWALSGAPTRSAEDKLIERVERLGERLAQVSEDLPQPPRKQKRTPKGPTSVVPDLPMPLSKLPINPSKLDLNKPLKAFRLHRGSYLKTIAEQKQFVDDYLSHLPREQWPIMVDMNGLLFTLRPEMEQRAVKMYADRIKAQSDMEEGLTQYRRIVTDTINEVQASSYADPPEDRDAYKPQLGVGVSGQSESAALKRLMAVLPDVKKDRQGIKSAVWWSEKRHMAASTNGQRLLIVRDLTGMPKGAILNEDHIDTMLKASNLDRTDGTRIAVHFDLLYTLTQGVMKARSEVPGDAKKLGNYIGLKIGVDNRTAYFSVPDKESKEVFYTQLPTDIVRRDQKTLDSIAFLGINVDSKYLAAALKHHNPDKNTVVITIFERLSPMIVNVLGTNDTHVIMPMRV